MIKTWLVSGDTHGDTVRYSRFKSYKNPEEVAMIILGDTAFNYELNYNDTVRKRMASAYGGYIYCVRGNHEERPENVKNMIKEWDSNVCGFVYMEHDFPLIRYFIDGERYLIDGHSVLVLGGAYSVDKPYRLMRGAKWFAREQLSQEEMDAISRKYVGEKIDLILSHTCPLSWQPTDLFLRGIDQSSVDTSMEQWMELFKDSIDFKVWLFGHYHHDRIVRPGVEMCYENIEELKYIMDFWKNDSFEKLHPKKSLDPKYDRGR